jgi:hypothetical protein
MAKKQTARDAKLTALDTFTSLLREEPAKERNKSRILSKQKLEANAQVKARYEAYVKAVQTFKLARNTLMTTKNNLQAILDMPLYEAEKISQRKFWDFVLDEHGNMRYKNDERSYEEKAINYARQANAKPIYDDEDISFDWLDKDTPEDPGGTSEGTPEDTKYGLPAGTMDSLPGSLGDDVQGYLNTFRKIEGIKKRVLFFRDELSYGEGEAQEQALFFGWLDSKEQKPLWARLNQEEKTRLRAEVAQSVIDDLEAA